MRYAPEGTKLDKLDVVVPSIGTVTGAGTISPNNDLDFNLLANLSGAVGGGLTKVAGMGKGGVPVKVGGTMASPTFAPDMKGMLGNNLKGLIPGGKSNPVGNLGGLFGKKK